MVDFFDWLYTSIVNKRQLLVKLKYYSLQRVVIRCTANLVIPIYYQITQSKFNLDLNSKSEEKRLIVSLTTFPGRIGRVWIAIESLLRQTHKPDKIILWLSRQQFNSLNEIPLKLLNQQERGLEIKFVDGDIKSHKKYFYFLKEYPKDFLITVDDDIIYPTFLLGKLVEYNKSYPDSICCHRAKLITFKHSQLMPYDEWIELKTNEGPSFKIFQTSGGGTLYPPQSLHSQVLNDTVFKNLCFYADDIWLNVMSQMNNTSIVKTGYYSTLLPILNFNRQNLTTINVNNMGNDRQLHAVRKFYLENLKIDPFKNLLQ